MTIKIDLDTVVSEARDFIENNLRCPYNSYLLVVFTWMRKHGAMLGGNLGIYTHLDTNQLTTGELMTLIVHLNKPYRAVQELLIELSNVDPVAGRINCTERFTGSIERGYIFADMGINNHYIIVIDNKLRIEIAEVTTGWVTEKLNKNVVEPVECKLLWPALIDNKLNVMPLNVGMIWVYSTLCECVKCDDWPRMMQYHDMWVARLGAKKKPLQRRKDLSVVKVLDKCLPKDTWAYFDIDGGPLRITCTLGALELCNKLSTHWPDIKYKVRDFALPMPSQIRGAKYVYSEGNKDILYCYNHAEYELIPVKEKSGIRTVSERYVARLMLIEVWIVKCLEATGIVSEHHKLNEKLERSLCESLPYVGDDPQTSDMHADLWIGSWVPFSRWLKIHIKRRDHIWPDRKILKAT